MGWSIADKWKGPPLGRYSWDFHYWQGSAFDAGPVWVEGVAFPAALTATIKTDLLPPITLDVALVEGEGPNLARLEVISKPGERITAVGLQRVAAEADWLSLFAYANYAASHYYDDRTGRFALHLADADSPDDFDARGRALKTMQRWHRRRRTADKAATLAQVVELHDKYVQQQGTTYGYAPWVAAQMNLGAQTVRRYYSEAMKGKQT